MITLVEVRVLEYLEKHGAASMLTLQDTNVAHGSTMGYLHSLGYVLSSNRGFIITDTGRLALEEWQGAQVADDVHNDEPASDEDIRIHELEARIAELEALLSEARQVLAPIRYVVNWNIAPEESNQRDICLLYTFINGQQTRLLYANNDDPMTVRHLRAIADFAKNLDGGGDE